MNVLVIPEDFRKDQYIVKPIVERLLAEIGKPNAKVRVCRDPLMGGIAEAMKWQRIREVLERYVGMVQVFVLLVDRDGMPGRKTQLDNLTLQATELIGDEKFFVAENAWQEIEVWALAGQDLPGDWRWNEIRQEKHPKERYFDSWAKTRGLTKEPGEGRTTMGREAAKNYNRVRARCPEDIVQLEDKLRNWFESRA